MVGRPRRVTAMARDLVDRVVHTVESQTTPMQPDTIPASKVVLTLAVHGTEERQDVRDALEEAILVGRVETDGAGGVWVPE